MDSCETDCRSPKNKTLVLDESSKPLRLTSSARALGLLGASTPPLWHVAIGLTAAAVCEGNFSTAHLTGPRHPPIGPSRELGEQSISLLHIISYWSIGTRASHKADHAAPIPSVRVSQPTQEPQPSRYSRHMQAPFGTRESSMVCRSQPGAMQTGQANTVHTQHLERRSIARTRREADAGLVVPLELLKIASWPKHCFTTSPTVVRIASNTLVLVLSCDR